MCRGQAYDGLPAQSPKTWGLHITNKNPLVPVCTAPAARWKQILHYPNPPKARNLKKGRLEPARSLKTWDLHITGQKFNG